jgi:hypothetical protein
MLFAPPSPLCRYTELRAVASLQTCRAVAAARRHPQWRPLSIKAASTLEAPVRPNDIIASPRPDLLRAINSIYTPQVHICMHHMLDAQGAPALPIYKAHFVQDELSHNSDVLRRTIWRMHSAPAIQLKALSLDVQAGKNLNVPDRYYYLWRTSIIRFTACQRSIAGFTKSGAVTVLQLCI